MITKPNLGIPVILTGDCKQGIVAWGDETASIPNLSLAPVDPDATVEEVIDFGQFDFGQF